MLKQAAELGAAEYVRSLEPTEDLISKGDVIRWLKRLKKKATLLNEFEEKGMVTGNRIGSHANSMVMYSKAEIKSALFAKDNISILI